MSLFQRLEFGNRSGEWVFLLLLILMGLLFSLLLGYLTATIIWGSAAADAATRFHGLVTDANTIGFLKTVQLINHAGTFLAPALIFHYLLKSPPQWSMTHSTRNGVWWMVAIALLNFSVSPLIYYSQEINQLLHLPESFSGLETWMKATENRANLLTDSFLTDTTTGGLLANMIIMALLPALGEELLFRGIIQPKLIKLLGNKHLGIFVTALLFSAMHLQFYGFIPRFLLGLLFGYFFQWTKNLWTAVWAHLLNNGTSVILAYLADKEWSNIDYENFGQTSHVVLALSFVVTALLIVAVFRTATTDSKTSI